MFSGNIIRPLEKLTISMKEINRQWFENQEYSEYLSDIPFISNGNNDEISFLESDFKLLVNKINSLARENYEKRIIMKEWQLKALQRQINPHFLYNTLDSIHWLAIINNQDQISTMVKSLGNLLRNAIYKSDYIVSIKDEIKILQDYINIQKFRFQERLNINIDINEAIWDYEILNLTLQPLVENSINHALEVFIDICNIEVFAYDNDNEIRIVVKDDGPGVDVECLKKLKKMEVEPSNSGIGLKNINERLKIIFGNEYGLMIESEPGKGFDVVVCIPKKKGLN